MKVLWFYTMVAEKVDVRSLALSAPSPTYSRRLEPRPHTIDDWNRTH